MNSARYIPIHFRTYSNSFSSTLPCIDFVDYVFFVFHTYIIATCLGFATTIFTFFCVSKFAFTLKLFILNSLRVRSRFVNPYLKNNYCIFIQHGSYHISAKKSNFVPIFFWSGMFLIGWAIFDMIKVHK